MRASLILLALAGCATSAPPAIPLPSRAEAEQAISAEFVCIDTDGFTHCPPPLRGVHLSRFRCLAAEDEDHPARVLCRYRGEVVNVRGSRRPLGHDCAYFVREPDGRWRHESHPDQDMCER